MNRDMFFGWRQVCAFSYVQTMKSKAMKITLAILCILVLISVPAVTMIKAAASDEEETKIKTAYIYGNEETITKKFVTEYQGKYKNIQAELIGEDVKEEKLADLKKNGKQADYVVIQLMYDSNKESMDYGLEINAVYGEKSEITKKDADRFARYLVDNKESFLLKGSSLDDNEIKNILKSNEYRLFSVDKDGIVSSHDESLNQIEYSVVYVYLMVAMFAVIIAGSKVAELLVTEKTSKVMEYLLTSIKALALLLGKVISTMLIVFTILGVLALSFFMSLVLNCVIAGGDGGLWPEFFRNLVESGVFKGLTPVNMILGIAVLLVGFLFYGFIAGLAGATVGKVEELSEGLKLFTFAVLIGCYLVIALMMFAGAGEGMGTFSYVVYYLPFSSVFIVPPYLILGKISLQTGLVAFVVLAVSAIVVWIFVTKVFESVLYHNGSVVKFKEILAIYKTNAKSGKSSEVKNER